MSSVINQFVQKYEAEFEHYESLALACEERCRLLLKQHHIPAIVMSRAKCPIQLRQKLETRDPQLLYRTESDIRANIPDLSGVRIALYFPGHMRKVARLLQQTFPPMFVKVYNSQPPALEDASARPSSDFVYPGVPVLDIVRPTGYRAVHLHSMVSSNTFRQAQDWISDPPQVEIQISSVLMHAWSEVEHDVVYKCGGEAPTDEEMQILGQINTCLAKGEMLLRDLGKSILSRQKKGRQRWEKL